MTGVVHALSAEGIMVITLDRFEARNAITVDMAREMAALLDVYDDDPRARVAVLHGNGGVFSAGMDLKRFNEDGTRPLDPVRGGGGLTWQPPRKPIIAAVEGYALGLGFEMALACDLVVAAEDALFGLPEVRHGLVAAGGGVLRLPGRIPRSAAMEVLLTGRPVGAQRLHQLGLVNRLAGPGTALEVAVSLAAEVAECPADAVQFTKELVGLSRDWKESEAFARQETLIAAFLGSRHGQPGPAHA